MQVLKVHNDRLPPSASLSLVVDFLFCLQSVFPVYVSLLEYCRGNHCYLEYLYNTCTFIRAHLLFPLNSQIDVILYQSLKLLLSLFIS